MKNILSYELGSLFTGKEIKEWILTNLNPNSSHFSVAKTLKPFLNLKDEKSIFWQKKIILLAQLIIIIFLLQHKYCNIWLVS